MRNNQGHSPDDGNIVGTSAFYEPNTDRDPVIQPTRDPFPALGYPENPDVPSWSKASTKLPDQDTGGFFESIQRLGFSWGLGAFRMGTRMRGQLIERDPIGLHPADGPVGFGTRSNRRPVFLYTDYTPSDEEVAKAAMANWRKVSL